MKLYICERFLKIYVVRLGLRVAEWGSQKALRDGLTELLILNSVGFADNNKNLQNVQPYPLNMHISNCSVEQPSSTHQSIGDGQRREKFSALGVNTV